MKKLLLYMIATVLVLGGAKVLKEKSVNNEPIALTTAYATNLNTEHTVSHTEETTIQTNKKSLKERFIFALDELFYNVSLQSGVKHTNVRGGHGIYSSY